ncbi:MAG: response regulator [Chitinivibrionales bacterium]|nr:response regulator [Chitinivibrionales bacterium]MBD3394408.1 response regulator [Chitinivibrionales bacterium]
MKVLIVEDDESVRRFLSDVIAMEGYDIRTADNGSTGVQAYREFEPDLIVSDIEMPVMDGLAMLEKIRRFDTESIVVMITGHGSEEYAVKALRLGAHNYLKKPIHHTALVELLNKYRSVVANRTATGSLPGRTVRREFTMEFKNCLEDVDKVVDHLVHQASDRLSRRDRLGLHLGLLELLVNSMEHGNLEISYEEKSRAIEKGLLQELRDQRRANEALANRCVKVDFRSDQTGCEWIIADEGAGFDWKSVPDPLHPTNLTSHNGRGIVISRRHFDEFEYIGKGNIVRVKKRTNGGAS